MAELSMLTDRILKEANEKADLILKEANEKAEKIKENSEKKAEQKYNLIVEKGSKEAENLKDRLISNAKLKARDNELREKQEIIKKVYKKTIEDLEDIDSDRFIKYIKNNASFTQESTVVVPEDKMDLVKKEFPDLKVSSDRNVKSGFIEIIGGIEKNFTFGTQLEYIKDDVQSEIAKVLFK